MYIDSFFVVLTQGCGWQVPMKYYLGWSILWSVQKNEERFMFYHLWVVVDIENGYSAVAWVDINGANIGRHIVTRYYFKNTFKDMVVICHYSGWWYGMFLQSLIGYEKIFRWVSYEYMDVLWGLPIWRFLLAMCLYVLESFTTAFWFPMRWCIIFVLVSGANGGI